MRKRMRIDFEDEIRNIIEKGSKELGITKKKFLIECVLSYTGKVLIKDTGHGLTFNQLEILGFLYKHKESVFYPTLLETYAITGAVGYSKRSVREGLKALLLRKYIHEADNEGGYKEKKGMRFYKITQKGISLLDKPEST